MSEKEKLIKITKEIMRAINELDSILEIYYEDLADLLSRLKGK